MNRDVIERDGRRNITPKEQERSECIQNAFRTVHSIISLLSNFRLQALGHFH